MLDRQLKDYDSGAEIPLSLDKLFTGIYTSVDNRKLDPHILTTKLLTVVTSTEGEQLPVYIIGSRETVAMHPVNPDEPGRYRLEEREFNLSKHPRLKPCGCLSEFMLGQNEVTVFGVRENAQGIVDIAQDLITDSGEPFGPFTVADIRAVFLFAPSIYGNRQPLGVDKCAGFVLVDKITNHPDPILEEMLKAHPALAIHLVK